MTQEMLGKLKSDVMSRSIPIPNIETQLYGDLEAAEVNPSLITNYLNSLRNEISEKSIEVMSTDELEELQVSFICFMIAAGFIFHSEKVSDDLQEKVIVLIKELTTNHRLASDGYRSIVASFVTGSSNVAWYVYHKMLVK